MTYAKQNFTDGNILYAESLNAMDNEISNLQTNLDTMDNEISSLSTNLINTIYPIGSIYMSVNSTSPATLFGGTWAQIKDTFLLAAGSSYVAGSTGGEATHTLTTNEMPKHQHKFNSYTYGYAANSLEVDNYVTPTICIGRTYEESPQADTRTNYTGGSAAHNNMPPYLAVYMWKRTA